MNEKIKQKQIFIGPKECQSYNLSLIYLNHYFSKYVFEFEKNWCDYTFKRFLKKSNVAFQQPLKIITRYVSTYYQNTPKTFISSVKDGVKSKNKTAHTFQITI